MNTVRHPGENRGPGHILTGCRIGVRHDTIRERALLEIRLDQWLSILFER